MIMPMTTTGRFQQRYDHRLRELVQGTGDVTIATDLGVPHSTARGWLGKAPRVVDPRQNSSPLIFRIDASHDRCMLELLLIAARALALALRGHRELVLENLALRQQLTAMKRSANRPRLERGRSTVLDRLGASLAELAHGVGGRAAGHRCPVASRLAPPPMDPTFETATARPSTSRSTDPRSRP
jgi:hypothetical protein